MKSRNSTTFNPQDLIDNWERYFLNNPPIDIYSIFSRESPMYGFAIPFTDFEYLISRVNTKLFKIRFGLDNNRQFILVFWGADENNNISTDYFVTEPHEANQQPFPRVIVTNSEDTRLITDQIPVAMAQRWLDNWEDLMNRRDISINLFKLNKEVLRGYTFKYEDFLYLLKEISYSDITSYKINFCFANHKYGEGDENGTFGLLMFANKTSNNKVRDGDGRGGIFFDISTPCPPTC